MAVLPEESRDTLGLLNVSLINDTDRIGLRSPNERREASDRQSRRWEDGVANAASIVGNKSQLVHVMDRECDSYLQELDTPEGEVPVEWHLMTTLPVDTPEQVVEVVDTYRGSWMIEEYFKALKTGCSFQKRQLESYHALTLAMAVLAPVAWIMLRLKTLQREAPDLPATKVLTRTQLIIPREIARDPFPENPTVKDAFFAIARKGGFLKHNKSPEWQTPGAGFEKLLIMESAGFLKERCDQ